MKALPVVVFSMLGAYSADAAAPPFHPGAWLLEAGKDPVEIQVTGANQGVIQYREGVAGTDPAKELKSGPHGVIFFQEPVDYTRAMDLFLARKYQEARVLFAAVKERYRLLEGLDDNYSALAGYHELECLRKTGDLEGLAKALPGLPKGALSREYQQRQLELYVFWDAVRTKSWERVLDLAKEHSGVRLPGDQRAQVDYCQGVALEALGRADEAVVAYESALTADGGASEEIARQAILRILGIHRKDPEVRAALNSQGRNSPRLDEARALVRLYEGSFGGGSPLPPELKEFR